MKANNNNNNGRKELAEAEVKLEYLKEQLATDRARKLVPIIKRSGWYKGEVLDLTPNQFRKFIGYAPKKAVIRKGKVPWEYALDQLATELGYKSDEDLRKAIESVGKAKHQAEELERKIRILEEEMAMAKVKEKEPRKVAVKFERKRIVINGRVSAYQVTRGKDTLGYIVAFPPSYGIYPSKNGLSLEITPVGGAKSIKKAKEIAKEKLRR